MGILFFSFKHCLHTLREKLEKSQALKWNLAGGGTLRSVVVAQHGEKNHL